jgi:Na+-driven multidrug efflux pump
MILMAYIGAFVFGLPVYWVYLLVITEEIGKVLVALHRFFSGKWVHMLVEPEVAGTG